MSAELYYKIYKFGKFYNPATNHYNKPNISVHCDRCKKNNLLTCIGYNDCDLCL